jgi:hypothetical protein
VVTVLKIILLEGSVNQHTENMKRVILEIIGLRALT